MTDQLEDYLEQITTDATLRAVLRAARSWGVSPGRFLGNEPARTYTLERDDVGRVARIVEHTDPEWDGQSRELALALEAYEVGLCSGCRQPLSETTDPAAEGRYVSDPPILCHACTALSIGAEPYQEHAHAQALRFGVRLKPSKTT